MTFHRFSPAILTLLVFFLAQGLGSLLLFGIWILVSPEFGEAIRAFLSGETEGLPLLELMPISVFSLILMSLDIIAVLGCHLCLHNIRFATTLDATTVRWRPALLAAAAAILGAMSISILTGGMELPEAMVQISLAMSHNFWGLITIVLVGPISEELLFREAIAGEMLRRGAAPWLAIGVSALAFSAAHLNLAQGCYAFPLGILLGIIYYKTGGIVLTSLLHILNNGIVAVQLYADGTEAIETSPAEWFGSTTLAQTFMVLFGALSIALMTLFWNRYNLCK